MSIRFVQRVFLVVCVAALNTSWADTSTVRPAKAQAWTWSAEFEGEGSSAFKARLNALVVDSADNAIVAGSALGPLRLKGGFELPGDTNEHAFIAKVSKNGRLLWARRMGVIRGSSELVEHGITAMTIKRDIVTAIGDLDVNDQTADPSSEPGRPRRLLRLDSEGRALGMSVFDQHADILAVAHGPGTDLYVAGCLRRWVGGFAPRREQLGAFVGRISANGRWIWSRSLRNERADLSAGNPANANKLDCASSIAPVPGGGFVVAGPFMHPFQLGGERLNGDAGSFLVRYSADGEARWARLVSDRWNTRRQERPSVAVRDGEVIVPRFVSKDAVGGILPGIAAYSLNGSRLWSQSISTGSSHSEIGDLIIAANGPRTAVAGHGGGTQLRVGDEVVADMDGSGTFVVSITPDGRASATRRLAPLSGSPTVLAAGKAGWWVAGNQQSTGGGTAIFLQYVGK